MNNKNLKIKKGFTLAETLITLVIIGVVAAITVPAVMNNIKSKQKDEKVRNVYHKLSKSTDKMLAISGMNGYSSTEEFLKAFKQHLSIAKVCKPDKIQDCWGSKEVILTDGKKWDISQTKTTKELLIPSTGEYTGYKDIMGFVMNDGTPFIVSYNTQCDMSLSSKKVWIADKSSSTSCLAGVFDYNGGSKPNKLTSDVLNFNASGGLGVGCAFKLNGQCYLPAQAVVTPMTHDECVNSKAALGLSYCRDDNDDYYAAAAKLCGGRQNIISQAELQKLADEIYTGLTTVAHAWEYCNNDSSGNTKCKNNDVAIKYGLGTSTTSVWAWASSEYSTSRAGLRFFYPHASGYSDGSGYDYRNNPGGIVLCKGNL